MKKPFNQIAAAVHAEWHKFVHCENPLRGRETACAQGLSGIPLPANVADFVLRQMYDPSYSPAATGAPVPPLPENRL